MKEYYNSPSLNEIFVNTVSVFNSSPVSGISCFCDVNCL